MEPYKTSVAEITVLEKDLLRIEYRKDVHIDLPELEESLSVYKKIMGDRRFYILSVINDGVTHSLGARNYWTTKERSDIKIAEAFVLSSLAHKMVAKFVTMVQPPTHEVKYFQKEEEALAWLKEKMKKN